MSKLLSQLLVGSLVKDTNTKYNNATIIWRILEHDHDGQGTTSLEARDILTLKCFDAKEPNNSDSNRQTYGNNRYLYSNLLQWLNSDASAGQWYTAQHTADNAPTSSTDTSYNAYTNKAGFLNGFSDNLKTVLQTVPKTTVLNTVTDGGGSENVSSKVFLLSTTEVGLANENNIAEGSIYAYYDADNTNSRRLKYPTAESVTESDYSSSSFSASSPWYWWLRTPRFTYSYYARYVLTDGSLNDGTAYNGVIGVSPAYVIPSTIQVSDNADSDGAYTIIWLEPIAKPTMPTTSYQATGSAITPTLQGYDSTTMTMSGDTSGTAVGNYTLLVTPKSGYQWNDGTTTAISFNWSITNPLISHINVGGTTYDIHDPNAGSADIVKVSYDETTATKAHAVDSYVYLNDVVYKVTTAIAIGDTITTTGVGANITSDTGLQADTQVYIDGLPGGGGGGGDDSEYKRYYDIANKTTTFNSNGSITEVNTDESTTVTTVFNANGSITETIVDSVNNKTYTKTTTFNQDGSISETYTES